MAKIPSTPSSRCFFFLLLLALAAYGQQQKRIAIVNTEDDGEPQLKIQELFHLTDKLREIANKVLPSDKYAVMTQQSIQDNLGSLENMQKKCSEAQGCLAKLGREINADYIGQARIGRFGEELTIKVELYGSGNGTLINSFTGTAKNIYGLSSIIDQKAPDLFQKMLPKEQPVAAAAPPPAPVIDSTAIKTQMLLQQQMQQQMQMLQMQQQQMLQQQQEMLKEQPKGQQVAAIPIVNIMSEPLGATLTFDGKPNSYCPKTPCVTELAKGKHSISAFLNLGNGLNETADTTVFIMENTREVNIKLNPNYGTLGIRPSYFNGIGSYEQWDLTLDGNRAYWNGTNVLPGSHEGKLTHSCYEDINFSASVNKGEGKYFDISDKLVPKKGYLVLKAESKNTNVKEPVWIDGSQVGKTPFSDSVSICSRIEVGKEKERVNARLEPGKPVEHTHKMTPHSQTGLRVGYLRNSIDFPDDGMPEELSGKNLVSSGFGFGLFRNIQTSGGIVSWNLELNLFFMSSDSLILPIWQTDFIGGNCRYYGSCEFSKIYGYYEESGLLTNLSFIMQVMPVKSIPLYLAAGLSLDWHFYSDEGHTSGIGNTSEQLISGDRYYYAPDIDFYNWYDLGFVFGVGYYITPNIVADFKYGLMLSQEANSFGDQNDLSGRVGNSLSQLSFGISYLF